VIKEGSVSVQKNGRVLKTMRKYESFGEKALFYNTLRQVTVMAEEKTICMILGRDTLCQQLGDEIF
jgi:cGMP-dependent protein kinase